MNNILTTNDLASYETQVGGASRPPSTSRTNDEDRARRNRKLLLLTTFFTGVALFVVLYAVLSGKDDDKERTLPPVVEVPVEFDFRTGVSLITYYGVEATISQRLARTVITMQMIMQ